MKDWYKLIIKCIAFVALVLLVDLGMGKVFVLAKDIGLTKHPEDMWLKTSYAIEKVQSDVIIIGSSTAVHHYIPSLIEEKSGLSTYNCGQDGCFFLYNACTINAILERYNPKVIIWDLNPHSLLNTDGGDEYQNMRYLSYYYDNDTIVEKYINKREERMPLYYLINGYKYNSHFVYTFYPIIHNTPTQKGYIPLGCDEGTKFDKNNVLWCGDWVKDELIELKYTIDNCKSKGVKLIIVTSPYYAQYDNSVKEKCEEFSTMMKNQNVSYLNLLYGEPFVSDPTLFRDNAHLNTKGAELMTDTLISAISFIMNM